MSEQDQKVVSIDKNKEVALHMTVEAAQYLLQLLGERPFNEVRVLITSFDQQLTRQLVPQEAEAPANFDEAIGE